MDVGIAEVGGDLLRGEGGGHHEEPQVGTEHATHVHGHRVADVARERALVEFVEDHEPHVGEFRIVQEALREQALRDDLKPRTRADAAFEAHLKPDRLAHALAEAACDVRRAAAGGEAARLQHENLLSPQEGAVEKRGRHTRGLAASWRRAQHHVAVRLKRRANAGNDRLDWEHGRIRPALSNCAFSGTSAN